MSTIRIATRRSDLALWQARHVSAAIEAQLGVQTELVPLQSTGDRLAGSLAKVGGKGLFVKEIEEALLEGRAEVAVHSAKDLPAESPEELCFAAFPERADPRDALVARGGATLATLPPGARVGTGSVRRTAQLARLRPDLEVVPLRGNVPTRLARVEGEDALDAVVLACAGLDRLGHGARIAERIAPDALLPSVAQGALAVQARRDGALAGDLAALGHPPTAARVEAERAFLAALEGDCNVPLAALARTEGDTLSLAGLVISLDGKLSASATATAPVSEAARLGAEVARDVLAGGGREILAALRGEFAP